MSDANKISDLGQKIRDATDPAKQKQFNLNQSIVLLDALEPIVATMESLVATMESLVARLALLEENAEQQGHAGRVTEERKDKGPPQVGG